MILYLDARVGVLEGGHTGHQPFGCERGRRADGEQALAVGAPQPGRRPTQVLERSADRGQIGFGLACQRQGAIPPHEQRDADLLLQPVDLVADRGLGDVQFGGGAREAQMARRCLEGTQSVQRRQGQRHAATLA